MKSFHLIIQGDVVGVGYRAFLKKEAERLGIVGWVKNREDKSVEVVVQGEEKAVLQIIEKVKIGPEVAWIEKVTVREEPVNKNLLLFEVVY